MLGLVLYYFISRTFDDVSSSDLGGAPSYFSFAAVGFVLGTVIVGTTTSVGYRIREEQTTGTLEALAATPVGSTELSVGLVGFPFVFALAQAAFYLAAASIMGLDASNASWGGLVVVLLVSGVALAPIGVLAGAAVLVFKRGQMIAGAIVYLMTLLGGMLFPVSVLPEWLQPLADLVPLRYALDGARDALFAGSGWEGDAARARSLGARSLAAGALRIRPRRSVRAPGRLAVRVLASGGSTSPAPRPKGARKARCHPEGPPAVCGGQPHAPATGARRPHAHEVGRRKDAAYDEADARPGRRELREPAEPLRQRRGRLRAKGDMRRRSRIDMRAPAAERHPVDRGADPQRTREARPPVRRARPPHARWTARLWREPGRGRPSSSRWRVRGGRRSARCEVPWRGD